MTMTIPTLLAVAASLLISPTQASGTKAVVASAGDVRVTADELIDVVRSAREGDDIQGLADSLSVDGLESFASRLLERKVLASEARARGLERDPLVARQLVATAEGLLADAVVDEVREGVDSSEPALRRFYREHEARFRTGPRRRARHIVVQSEAEAIAALAEVRAGKPFSEVAGARNQDATRSSGGALGWVPRNLMVKPFEDVVFALPAGGVSEPVKTHFGWHVVTVEEIDPGTLAPFELIKDKVLEAARIDAIEQLKATLWRRNPAVIDRAALGTLLK